MNETNEAAAKAQAVHQVLDSLGINYAEIKHPPVFTASQAIAAMIQLTPTLKRSPN